MPGRLLNSSSDDESILGDGEFQTALSNLDAEEFHTDASESEDEGVAAGADEDDDAEELVSDDEAQGDRKLSRKEDASQSLLLPASILKPTRPTSAPQIDPSTIPWEQLTSLQKRRRRQHAGRSKKKTMEALRQRAKGTGIVAAGKAAQQKRDVDGQMSTTTRITPRMVRGGRVRAGRVEKSKSNQVSGRQRMLEERKSLRQGGGSGAGAGQACKSAKGSKKTR